MHLLSLFSLRNRALIALVTIVIGLFGGVALTSLKQELIPSVSFPQLVIVTNYPGASPAVVERDVSTPIESAIQGVEGINGSSTTSSAGSSTVSATFDYGTDIVRAEQRVQLSINRIEGALPEDVDPRVITGSIDDFPIISVAVTSDLTLEELSDRVEDVVVPELQTLDGVREANVTGAAGQRITITPDAAALAADGLTTTAITDALRQNGTLLAAGEIDEGGEELTVQAGTRIASLDEIEQLPLLGGAPGVVLGDVATVELVENPTDSISRVNGDPALTISITKAAAGNTVDVSHVVQDALPALADRLGDGAEFTVVFDQAPFIEQSIESLATEGALGLVFAVIVILVFLLSIRSTLVTAISIPASVLVTFIGMWASGYTLNILTLGALTISIGRVVDDSIVVIENIKRHLAIGDDKLTAIKTGVREVATAITASTVSTVAVFLPLALVADITGELFRPFALTVTIALGASLFVSLTIVPVLAYWFLGTRPLTARARARAQKQSEAAARGEDELERPSALQRGYLPIIDWTLRFPAVTLIAALLVLAGTGALATQLKTNFLGDSGQNTLNVSQTLPPGTDLETRDEAATRIEEALLELEEIETVQLSVGSGGVFAAFSGGGEASTFSVTTDPDADQEQVAAEVRETIDELDDVGEVAVSLAGGGVASTNIEIDIRAGDEGTLREAADGVLAAVEDLAITAEAQSDLSTTQPYVAIEVDRTAAAEYGLSEVAVGSLVSQAMLPSAATQVTIDEATLSVYVLAEDAPDGLDELRGFDLPTPLGLISLGDIATVDRSEGPASISTVRGERTATVEVTPNGDDVGTATFEVQTAIDELDLPQGVTVELGGVSADQATAFEQLGLALLAAILIVYTIMVATFRSLRQPLLLLVSVPFAATGAIILHVITGIPLGVASLIGVLMLIGIVVTNAIVLIDLVNQYRDRGMSVPEAIRHGAARRLRPILMTALATIFALVPMALGITGHGGFISQPLAIVVIGGLVSSTLLTLVVLPTLYALVEGARERRVARRAARDASSHPPKHVAG